MRPSLVVEGAGDVLLEDGVETGDKYPADLRVGELGDATGDGEDFLYAFPLKPSSLRAPATTVWSRQSP